MAQKRIGAYSPETAKRIKEVVSYLESNGFMLSKGQKKSYNPTPNTPIYFRNDSGETIPPFACLQASGTVEIGTAPTKQNYIKAIQPSDATGDAGPFFFNLFREVADGEFGVGDAGPCVRATGAALTAGAAMQPSAGSFSLVEGGNFCRCIGEDDIEDGVIRIITSGGGGGASSGAMIIWQYESPYGTYDTTSDDCGEKKKVFIDTPSVATQLRVKVEGHSCGSTVYGMDDEGYVTVKDSSAGRFLEYRLERELDGVTGFATLMSGQGGYEACDWIITWINWFQERQFVQDWYVRDLEIVEEKVNAFVWNWCQLPDEITTGVDCDPDDYIYGQE